MALDTNKFHASSRFAFRAKIIIPEAAVSDLGSTSSEIAVSVADKAVCLVTTTNGLPFSYMTENFWVSFSDRSLPGTLVYMAVGNPQFVLANSETNEFKIDFHFGFDAAFDRPNIAINLAGLFDPSFSAQPPAYDEKTRELAFVSKTGAKVFLMMSQRESDPFGIDAIRLERKAKLMIDSIQSQVAANTLPVLATGDLERLGIPMVALSTKRMFPAGIPVDFPKNEEELKAAERLRSLFPSLGGK